MMLKRWYLVCIPALLLLIGCAEVDTNDETPPAQEAVSVPMQLQAGEISGDKNLWVLRKENDTAWRIWDRCGNNLGHLLVTGGDNITWNTYDSDMTFTFSRSDLSMIFQEGELLSDRENTMLTENEDSLNIEVAEGDSLSLAIRENAPRGRLSYNIYVADADTVVEGGTPPVLIVY